MRIIAAKVYPVPFFGNFERRPCLQFETRTFLLALGLEICYITVFLKLGKQSRKKMRQRMEKKRCLNKITMRKWKRKGSDLCLVT